MTGSMVNRLGNAPEEGIKAPVLVETIAPITLFGLQTVNGVALSVYDRVLVKDQVTASENGIYNVGIEEWERATDMNDTDDVSTGQMVLSNETLIIYQVSIPSAWNPDTTAINFPLLLTGSFSAWGDITGTLSDQIDLQAALDLKLDATHAADATIHFTEASIVHQNISGAGTNDHAAIDSHIGDAALHYNQAAISITLSQVSDSGTAAALNTGITNGTIPLIGAGDVLPSSIIPAIAISQTYVVANEAAQLALTVQEGDVAVRTDENKSYIALNSDNVDLGDWQELLTPTDAVTSVAGQTGVVVLTEASITDLGTTVLLNTTDTFTGVLTVDGDLALLDGDRLTFGTGDDLVMQFSGGINQWIFNSDVDLEFLDGNTANTRRFFFDISTGNMQMDGTLDVDGNIIVSDTGQLQMREGNVVLNTLTNSYLDLETTGTQGGIRITQNAVFSGYLLGNTSAQIGLATSTGDWVIRGTNAGTTEVYYDNAVKLATLTDGVQITGKAAVSGSIDLEAYSEDADSYTVSAGTKTLDTSVATYFYPTGGMTAVAITFAFSNPAASGRVTSFTLEMLNAGTLTGGGPTWPTSVDWHEGVEPSWTASGTDVVSFVTRDGGTTWLGFVGGLNFS